MTSRFARVSMPPMSQEPTPDFLKYILLGIDAEYEAAVREPHEIIERAKARRDALIEQAHKSAHGESGRASYSPAPPRAGATSSPPVEETPQENGIATNGHGMNIVSKDTVMKYVHEVMADPSVEIVTQPEIKDRILAHYPVSKDFLNNLRILIVTPLNELAEQGYLELVERARAGQPNKYRKTEKWAEETREHALRSGP